MPTFTSPTRVPTKAGSKPSGERRSAGRLARKCACGAGSSSVGQCEACGRRALEPQRPRSSGAAIPAIVQETIRSTGSPLDAPTRTLMESRFRHDFSRVRVHTDARSAESARAVGALAYAVGRDVVFAGGQYSPGTAAGRRLLAHELAHVVQQRKAPEASADLSLASPSLERDADAAAEAALSGARVPVLQLAERPVLARFRESRTRQEADGSEVQVDRVITPGRCALAPETRTDVAGDVTASEAFLEINLCRGRVGGQIRGALTYEAALDQARTAAMNLATNLTTQRPDQALRTFENDLRQIAPGGEVRLNFHAPGVRITVGGTGEASLAQGASGVASGRVEVDVGPVTIGAEGQVSGGTNDPTAAQGLVTLGTRDTSRQDRNCFICACREPRIEFQCSRRPPRAAPPPPTPRPQPVIVPLFFEYETTDPRHGWEAQYAQTLDLAVARIREGYTISRIEGNASPEGPEQPRRAGGFNNTELAQQRAVEARADLQAALRATLALSMRDTAALRTALAASYPVEGRGELFGSNARGEVAEHDLFRHLQTELATPAPGAPDPLAAAHVTGEGLPPDIASETATHVDEFRTGRRGRRRLTRAERLDAIYQPLRRALIFLAPPPPPPIRLDITPEIMERVLGTPIECTDAHRQEFASQPPPSDQMFEGECQQPGERPPDPGAP